jgi:DnaJ-domain-containing protein 1
MSVMSSATYRPKFGYDIRINANAPRRAAAPAKHCAVKGCHNAAELRVAMDRQNMDERHWLCRDHIRERNQRWNFFAGMSNEDVERFCLDAITGHRPTWPLGKRTATRRDRSDERKTQGFWSYRYEDGFAVFEEAASPTSGSRAARLTKGQLDALNILNLEENATLHQVKARYKELVKRFHPDANGGNRSTEERLRQVIKAYGHLRATGFA